MKIFIVLLVSVFISNSYADSRSFDRTWLGLFNKKKISETYSIWAEAQARMDNYKFTNQQLLLRTGLLKAIDATNEIGLLYGHIQTDELREHRPTLQYFHIFLKNDVSSFSIRNRLEYRKLENKDAISGRYRGMVRYQHGPFIIWEEPFLTFTSEDWTGNRLFERNRLFVGRGFKRENMNLEVGYMNQYIPRSSRTTSEHILTLYLFY